VTSILRSVEPKVEPGSWTGVRGAPCRQYTATDRYQVAKVESFDTVGAGQFGIDLSKFEGGEHVAQLIDREQLARRNARKSAVPPETG
jgi:hypothetical protein